MYSTGFSADLESKICCWAEGAKKGTDSSRADNEEEKSDGEDGGSEDSRKALLNRKAKPKAKGKAKPKAKGKAKAKGKGKATNSKVKKTN